MSTNIISCNIQFVFFKRICLKIRFNLFISVIGKVSYKNSTKIGGSTTKIGGSTVDNKIRQMRKQCFECLYSSIPDV
jgi:carbon monoxide dehydrogenase subunit G